MTLRVFSNGGGIQSTACLVLSAQGRIDFPVHLFANTGDDSENPDTLVFVREVAVPYATEHGIDLVEVRRQNRSGEPAETLWERLHRTERSIDIPVRLDDAAPGRRRCTTDYKRVPITRWLKAQGATADDQAVVGLGISTDEAQRARTDEAQRARTDSGIPEVTNEYPLLDLMLRHSDCRQVIEDAGLPVPAKSACFFCPYNRPDYWRRLHRESPELFAKAVELERVLHERGNRLGRRNVRLSSFRVPLDEAVVANEQLAFEGSDCESGDCMT